MAKSHGRAAAKRPETAERFPPLSTSLDVFVAEGTDGPFRRLIYDLASLANLMVRNRQHFGSYIGVTDSQQLMISFMAETPDSTVTQIAERMNVSSQFVTVEVGKLIARGIVDKRPSTTDRRSVVLNLTEHGRNLVRELAPLKLRINDAMFGTLTAEQARLLQDIVAQLVLNAQTILHDLEAPGMRGAMAPSARAEPPASGTTS